MKNGGNTVYFDNAATSFPKPKRVLYEVNRCISEYCGNPGRSSHRLSVAASEAIYDARSALAVFFGCRKPENVIFTLNATYALNIAIRSFVRRGDRVLISNVEHNSVIRPLHAVGADLRIFDSFRGKQTILAEVEKHLQSGIDAVVCNHASNICSAVNPVMEIGSLCRKYGVRYIVDISQSAGHCRIDMQKLKADAVCAPFHKGLFGIQGGGFVIFGEGVRHETLPLFVSGGNGMSAFDPSMPDMLPERLEAGTLPTPAAVSLIHGIDYITETGIDEIRGAEEALSRRIGDMLASTKGITLYGNGVSDGSTLLFNAEGFTSHELADRLDRYGICTRAGFHCSPLAHQKLGTGESGAVRLSFSCMNDIREADRFYRALKQIIS